MRKTKIICTLGPATDSDEVIEQLINEGMNVARFNFSHGSHEEHKQRMDRLKRIRKKCDAGQDRLSNDHVWRGISRLCRRPV